MNIGKIRMLGYFDRVMVDGYSMPMYNGRGIEIRTDCSLIDALNDRIDSNSQGIGKIKISIVGESLSNDTLEEIQRMQYHREKELGLDRVKLGNTDRYTLAYADIIILKSDSVLPTALLNKGNNIDDIRKIIKAEDQLKLINKAIEIQNKTIKNNKESNVAIIDKVFVHKEFRRCGISRWIHNNIKDLVKLYGMVDVGAALLTPGDFTNSAMTEFNMSKDYYEKMLTTHYKSVGYTLISEGIMYKDLNKAKFNIKDLLNNVSTQ